MQRKRKMSLKSPKQLEENAFVMDNETFFLWPSGYSTKEFDCLISR